MRHLLQLFNRKDIFCIQGMKSCLGHSTKRIDLTHKRFCELEDWIKQSKEHSIKFIFEDDTTEVIFI